MNKTKIDWADFVWNPITGCKTGCWYCYARRMYKRFGRSFEPAFHPEKMDQLRSFHPQYSPSKVFVCSVSDLFGPWVKKEWRDQVLEEIAKPRYLNMGVNFLLLTKWPQEIKLEPQENVWVGVTITNQDDYSKLRTLNKNYAGHKYISFEPLLGGIEIAPTDDFALAQIGWAIVGKLTGPTKAPWEDKWAQDLVEALRERHIPTFLKDNLNWPEDKRKVWAQYPYQLLPPFPSNYNSSRR